MLRKLDKITIVLSLIAILFLSAYVYGPSVSASVAPQGETSTTIAVLGDIGCKSTAKTNLNNIAKSGDKYLGLGDYLYNCSGSDVSKQWNAIRQEKHGVVGNHDDEKSSSMNWMRNNLGLGLNGWFSWKINDVAIIGVNTYKDFDEGSAQHAYLERKTAQFCGREDSTTSPISWVIYAMHEPIQTPSVGGGHGLNKPLRNVIEPLAEKCGNNVIILEAHNHITAFGNVQGNNHAMCGGGGQGGDSLGNANGFEFQTTTFGYCKLTLNNDGTAEVQLIATDGSVKGSHTYTSSSN